MVLVKRLELLAARMEIEGYHERFEITQRFTCTFLESSSIFEVSVLLD